VHVGVGFLVLEHALDVLDVLVELDLLNTGRLGVVARLFQVEVVEVPVDRGIVAEALVVVVLGVEYDHVGRDDLVFVHLDDVPHVQVLPLVVDELPLLQVVLQRALVVDFEVVEVDFDVLHSRHDDFNENYAQMKGN
jgi:hypothetical protein